MASLSRRSRMQRSRTGKRLELTARDLDIFRLLASYRYLSAPTLHAFVGGASHKRFIERLGDLYHEGYLDRPQRQWEIADCRHRPAVYELDLGARRILAEQAIAAEPRTWLGRAAHRQFAHATLICEILAAIEIATLRSTSLRLIAWPEILEKAPAATREATSPVGLPGPIIPDALFGLEYGDGLKKSYRFFALEADRATMPVLRTDPNQSSLLKKLETYRERICEKAHRTYWGVPNLLVLTVTTSENRMRLVMEKMAESPLGAAHFLFKAVESSAGSCLALCQHFGAAPWLRPGHEPLHIGRAQ